MALPSSGTITFDMIKTEISLSGSQSLQGLVLASNLADKTAPHDIHQFYGYQHVILTNDDWDLDSIDHIRDHTVSTKTSNDYEPLLLSFSQDGLKCLICYATGVASTVEFETHNLSTSFDISTMSLGTTNTVVIPNLTSGFTALSGASNQMGINKEGTEIYFSEITEFFSSPSRNTSRMYTYSLSTAFEASTIAYEGNISYDSNGAFGAWNLNYGVTLYSKHASGGNVRKFLYRTYTSPSEHRIFFTTAAQIDNSLTSNWTEITGSAISQIPRFLVTIGQDKHVIVRGTVQNKLEHRKLDTNIDTLGAVESNLSIGSISDAIFKLDCPNDDDLYMFVVAPNGANYDYVLKQYTTNYSVFATDTTTPTNPTSLVSSNINETTFRVTWVAGTDNVKVTSYDILLDDVLISSISHTQLFYDFSSLTADTAYVVKIKSVDGANNKSAGATLNVSTASPADTTPPTIPGVLDWDEMYQSNTAFRITWGLSTDADTPPVQYEVTRDDVVVSTTANAYFDETGRAIGYTADYKIRALDSASPANYSVFNIEATFGTNAGQSAIYAGIASTTSITISIGAATGASSYRIERRVNGAGSWIFDGTKSTSGNYTIDNLLADTSYEIRVISVNVQGAYTYSLTLVASTSPESGEDTFNIGMTSIGAANSSTACGQTPDITRYHDGPIQTPGNGDVIYTDSAGTFTFNGGNNWYSFENGTVARVSTLGVISNLNLCSA